MAETDVPGTAERDATVARLLLLLIVLTALGWATASVLVAHRLEDRAVQSLLARAGPLAESVTSQLQDGRSVTDSGLLRVLTVGNSWLVGTDGDLLAGPGELPQLPDAAAPAEAVARQRILAADGDDGLVASVPIFRDGEDRMVLVVAESGVPVRSQIATLRLLLAVVFAGLMLLVAAGGWSLLRQGRIRLQERTRALASLLRRERATIEGLAELDAMKTALLTATSHELRTPLTVLSGVAELLAERADQLSRDQVRELADRLRTKTARLAGLIDDLLDVDRLARGVLEPDRRDVDLQDLIERTVEGLGLGGHDLRFELTDEPVSVDPAHVQRVVENLLRNAVKYAPAGTPIDVRAKLDDDALEITVADRGPGIPDDRKQLVFEPLRRVEEGDPNPGLGVGLALVARLTQLHGGRAWVEDRSGGGLEVHARFADVGGGRG